MTTRSILFALALASAVVPTRAYADAPAAAPPTPAQIEQAKKAYGDGKKSFDAGDFPEAIAKFKESFNLSKNAGLLYNIGLAYESAGMKDLALFYYRKFLTDAPAENAQRPDATTRVEKLSKEFSPGETGPTRPTRPEPHKGPVVIKPPGTYQASDFQHLVVESAPPAKPLDITASVPEDSGWTVTLYFRTAGEGKFTTKDMHWRYKELVGRIPAPKMIGTSVQYYVEVKDTTGAVITRSGKSTSPNLVNLEAGAEPRFYPDLDETGERVQTQEELLQNDLDEDPLHKGQRKPKVIVKPVPGEGEGDGGDKAKLVKTPIGFITPGTQSYEYTKWGLTGAAVVSLGLSVTFYVLAGKQAQGLSDDSNGCGGPPCQPFDSYDSDIQKSGKRDQKLSNAFLGIGLGLTAVAGIWWFRDSRHSHEERLAAEKRKRGEATADWQVVPTITTPTTGNPGFSAGAAASLRF